MNMTHKRNHAVHMPKLIGECLKFVRDHDIHCATLSRDENGDAVSGIILSSGDGSAAIGIEVWQASRQYISCGIDTEDRITLFDVTEKGRFYLDGLPGMLQAMGMEP